MAGQGKGFVRKEQYNALRRRVESLESMFSTFANGIEAGEKSPVIEGTMEEVVIPESQEEAEEEVKVEYTYDEIIKILELKGIKYDKRTKDVAKLTEKLEEADG